MRYTIDDIDNALNNQEALLHNKDIISAETYVYLSVLSVKNKKLLLSELSEPNTKCQIDIECICERCGEMFTISKNKTRILSKYDNFPHLKYSRSEYYAISHSQYNGAKLCKDCVQYISDEYQKLLERTEKERREFYSDPVEWVNKHAENMQQSCWQKSQIKSLILSPKYLSEKYCGVQLITGEMFWSKEYKEWKKNLLLVERDSSINELICSVAGPFDSNNEELKKTVEIVSRIIRGIRDGADLNGLILYAENSFKSLIQVENKPAVDDKRRLTFGQYKGVTVQTIIETDPGYIHWLIKNAIRNFVLSDEELQHYLDLYGPDESHFKE